MPISIFRCARSCPRRLLAIGGGWLAAAPALLLAARPAFAIPDNFGSPFNPPPKMFFATDGLQVQSDHSWTMSLGGSYGLSRFIAPDFSLERTSSGADILGIGGGTAGMVGSFFVRIGLTASQALGSPLAPTYNVAVDWGRPLGWGLTTYGELGGGLTASEPSALMTPGLDYNQALELAINPVWSADVEYLGGLTPAGRSEVMCADLTASLGRTFVTGTVMFPRAPQAASPIYLVSTDFLLYP